MTEASSSNLILPDSEIIQEVLSGSSDSIIRMADNVGLFCNDQVEQTSGAKPNDWVGKNMRLYHVPEELSRYINALHKERTLNEFRYIAPFMDGRLHRFCVNARLVTYRGDLCRLVKVLECEPLS
ncbi:PAS domain-containing protein [Trichocoleus desertorum AS-A10]|uniref:PAS domain-containing protein n=1 Tax=Trichocoleus desertorum TaxID=1481672 RepID=UPI003298CAD3